MTINNCATFQISYFHNPLKLNERDANVGIGAMAHTLCGWKCRFKLQVCRYSSYEMYFDCALLYYCVYCLIKQVEYCRLPGLAVALTLDNAQENAATKGISDLVSFVSGLLLGNDITVRNWFAQFVRTGQKVRQSKCIFNKFLFVK